MAPLSSVRIYSPDEIPYATGRMLHSRNRYRSPNEHRKSAPSPVPRDSMSVAEYPKDFDDGVFDDAADIPNIPLTRSSKMHSTATDDLSSGDSYMRPTVMRQMFERDPEFMVPGRGGPIDPNSIESRYEKR